MPIPVTKLEDASRPLEDRILAFLGAKPDTAFSLPEIIGGLEDLSASTAQLVLTLADHTRGGALGAQYMQTISSLVESRRVRAAMVGVVEYYACAR